MAPLIGIDIGTTAVRVAEVTRRKDARVLTRYAQVGLPPAAAPEGEVLDERAVTATLKEAMNRAGFRTKRAALGIANQKVVVRQIDLPYMDDADLRTGLAYQVQEHIPIPVEDAILDFQVLEEIAGDEGERRLNILLVAAQRGMIEALVRSVTAAGVDPVTVDLAPFAALRAVMGEVPPVLSSRESQALVDVGGGVTNVVVHEQGTPRFVRILPMGGADISEALVAGLGIPVEDAESVKARIGCASQAGADVAEGAATIIETRVASFIEEVRGSIDYYLGQPNAAQITRIEMTGGGSQLPNLRSRVEAALHLPVGEADPLRFLEIGKLDLDSEQVAQITAVGAVALGLALEE